MENSEHSTANLEPRMAAGVSFRPFVGGSLLAVRCWLFPAICIALALQLDLAASAAGASVDFVRDVRPLLEKHCYECHGPEKQKNGYRLDVREIALKGGDSGEAAIRPHDAKQSPIIRFVSGEDEDMVMPPMKSKKRRLTATEVAVLRAWINEGPVWPDEFAGTSKDTKPHWL